MSEIDGPYGYTLHREITTIKGGSPVPGANALAVFVLALYDHVITFGDEVNYIWNYPRNCATIIFLLVRYFTLFTRLVNVFVLLIYRGLTITSCKIVVKLRIPALQLLISIILVHVILILRVHAFCGANTVVFALLVLLLFFEAVMMVIATYFVEESFAAPDSNNIDNCLYMPSGGQGASIIYWIAPLLMDTAIFSLTLWKTSRYAKSMRNVPLVKMLVRDGILYYLVITLAHFVNLMLFWLAPPQMKPVASGFSQALATILVSRLVFNLRKRCNKRRLAMVDGGHGEQSANNQESNTTGSSMDLTSVASMWDFFDTAQGLSHTSRDIRDMRHSLSLLPIGPNRSPFPRTENT